MGGWPFVERVEELRAVMAAVERDATGVLLLGSPGVGKTRLALEALRQGRDRGKATEWAAATAGAAAVPLGAVSHLIPPPPIGVEPQAGGLYHRLATQLGTSGDGGKLVLGFDDVHLLDGTSAALVHHLVTTNRVTLVATARMGEPLPEPIAALRKDGYLTRCEIVAFSDGAVDRLLTAALGGQVAASTVHRLAKVSGGNALYLHELVIGGLEAGRLAPRDGVWRWRGPLAAARLGELLEGRLNDVPLEDRQVLEILACAEPLAVAAVGVLEPQADLEDLERRGLITVEADHEEICLRLAHPLYADVLRASLPELAIRRIWVRLADLLDTTGLRSGRDLLRLATWRVASDGKADTALLLAAANEAHAAADYVLAERLARAALDAGGGSDATLVLAVALSGQGRVEEATVLLDGLEAVADTDQQAQLAVTTAMEQFWFASRPADADDTMRRAAQLVEQGAQRIQTLTLASVQTGFLLLTASTTDTLRTAAQVLDAPDATELQLVRTSIPAAMAAALAGRAGDALRIVERAAPLAPLYAVQQPSSTDLLLANRSLAHRLCGRLDEALAQAQLGHEVSVEAGATAFAHPLWLLGLGQAYLTRGAIDDAVRWLREATVWLRDAGNHLFLAWALANLTQALGMAGESDQARRVLAAAEDSHDATFRAFDCDLHLGRAWAAAAAGEISRASGWALAAADAAGALDQYAFEVIALGDATRLGAAADTAPRLAALASEVDGDLAPALAAYAGGLAGSDAASVEEVAAGFGAMGAYLLAAEAWTESGRLHRQDGRLASARAAGMRAQELVALCRGAQTPTLAGLEDRPVLTRREREVAGLAGRGLSNVAIADSLHVSVRTVENHLHNVYGKLGLTGRADLTSLVDGER